MPIDRARKEAWRNTAGRRESPPGVMAMANEMIQRLTNQNDLPAVCSVQHANTIMMFKALFVALAVTAVHATPRDAVAGQQTILRGRIVQAQDPDLPVPQARITIDLPGGA